MGTLIRCWSEEPITPNQQLHQLDETTQDPIELDSSDGLGLNRYVLVPASPAEAAPALSAVVRSVIARLAAPAHWLLAWQSAPTEYRSPARIRYQRAKRAKEGWETVDGGGFSVSRRRIDEPLPAASWLPPGYTSRDGGLIGLIGRKPALTTFAHDDGAPTPSIRLLATTLRLAPSREFLAWLCQNHQTLIYPIRGDLGEDGLVVVSPSKLAFDRAGDAVEIRPVGEASAVWANRS